MVYCSGGGGGRGGGGGGGGGGGVITLKYILNYLPFTKRFQSIRVNV